MFTDAMRQGDGVGVAVECGLCGQLANANHKCEEMKKCQEQEATEKPKNSEMSSTSEDA